MPAVEASNIQYRAENYTIGWISALHIEYAAAQAMLEEIHLEPEDLERGENDTNAYTCGRLGHHNIVIVCLAGGVYGTTMASTTAMAMLHSFPNIKFGVMVGIGGGIPGNTDIRLGDVVVSCPNGRCGGVFQYDLGKNRRDQWERTDFLARPPEGLLKALNKLRSEHELHDSQLTQYLSEAYKRIPKYRNRYGYPAKDDLLFQASYDHVGPRKDCSACDMSQLIEREPRNSKDPEIHYGLIASGNSVMKNALARDKLVGMESGCLCLETEAAGLMNNFPCLVIRGICDYADSHKNDDWQRYASATGAAFAKELLLYVPQSDVIRAITARDILQQTSSAVATLQTEIEKSNLAQIKKKHNDIMLSLHTCSYEQCKDRNIIHAEGTCEWFITHKLFKNWKINPYARLLWVTADPGCGKSVLSRYLVDEVLPPVRHVCYFFFKAECSDQQSSSGAICSILHQIFTWRPTLLPTFVDELASQPLGLLSSFAKIWKLLLDISDHQDMDEIICVIDALDECQEQDRNELIQALSDFQLQQHLSKIKFLVTSRNYFDIRAAFHKVEEQVPTIHLNGEGDVVAAQISKEIDLVIKQRIEEISALKLFQDNQRKTILTHLTSVPNRTYLWAHLVLEDIKNTLDFGAEPIEVVFHLPQSVDEAYEKILRRSPNPELCRKMLSVIVAAFRPLTILELMVALSLSMANKPYDDLREDSTSERKRNLLVRETTGLFVNIVDGKVFLIHQTAKEFLIRISADPKDLITSLNLSKDRQGIWKNSIEAQEAHSIMADICSRCLSTGLGQTAFPEFQKYSSNYLFKHLFEAEFWLNRTLMSKSIYLLDQVLRHSLGTLFRELPDNERASNEYRPTVDAPLLLLLCYIGICPLVQEHLIQVPRADRQPTGEHPLLCITAARGNIRLAKILLKRGHDINMRAPEKRTPLHAAIDCGQYEMVQFLLARGAKIEAQTKEGLRPLHLAINRGRSSIIDLLIKKKADMEATVGDDRFTALFLAIQQGSVVVVALLLNNAAGVRADVMARSSKGATPLHHASKLGHANIVKLLLDNGAFIDDVGGRRSSLPIGFPGLTRIGTPLHYAAIYNHCAVAKVLLDRSANIESVATCYDPAFHLDSWDQDIKPITAAIRSRSADMIKLLLENGARLSLKDYTFEHYAAIGRSLLSENTPGLLSSATHQLSSIEADKLLEQINVIVDSALVVSLLTNYPNLQITYKHINAALQRARYYRASPKWGNVDRGVVAALMTRFPVRDLKAKQLKHLMELAEKAISVEFVSTLASSADTLHKLNPSEKHTCLRIAAAGGELQAVKSLLRVCSALDVPSSNGRTALSLAMSHGFLGEAEELPTVTNDCRRNYNLIASLLLEHGAEAERADNIGRTPIRWAEIVGNDEGRQTALQHLRESSS